MVVSKIDKTVHYVENKKIDEEDRGFATSLFEIEILGKDVVIGLGKEKHTYQHKNIVFFPIYLVANNEIKSKIGVYEMKSTDVISSLDEDGDINIESHEPLLFTFVKPRFLEKSGSSPDYYYNKAINEPKVQDKDKDKDKDKDEDAEEHKGKSIKSISTKMKAGDVHLTTHKIFEIDSNKNIPDLLPEETEDDADKLVKQYVLAPGHNWIKKFMENGEYEIVSNECGSVDSIYCIVRDAFSQIGHKTSVAALRTIVSNAITDEFYEKCLDKYLIFSSEISRIDREMRDIKKAMSTLKTRIETTKTKDAHAEIVKLADEQKDKYKQLAITKKIVELYAVEYTFMKEIKSADEMRSSNISVAMGAMHDFAVEAIEKELNIKIIGLYKDAFDQDDLHAVLQCYGDSDHANPKPRQYILMAHSMKNKKCELVSYKDKRIFVFGELPYHIKTLVVNKCMEHNGGTFPLIADFRNFKNKLGIKNADADAEDADDWVKTDLYDPSDVILFHEKSMSALPGELRGEKVIDAHITDYFNLTMMKGWRRMLDDKYEAQFKLDNKRWQTVEHYYQGAKFKKRNPDFYAMFSLDSDSDISKDLDKAIEAGNKKGKGRPKNISIDPDFYGLEKDGRSVEERKLALMAKFNQNEDLRRILLNTGKAMLKQYVKGELPKLDDALMEVRKRVK